MSVIVTRAGKGTTLSWVEADANFINLNNDKLEAGTPATNIAVTPTGGILATDVQAAINELDSEKAPVASPIFTGPVTSPQYYNVTATYGALQVNGADVMRFGQDNSGQLAGFRNILINGDMRINQRGVTIAAAANGAYGPDRWKKVDASYMTQIVEAWNFIPSATYTLSGTGVTTQQLTSPSSGNWTLPNIPIAATKIQLEEGSIATPFEQRPIGLEMSLCQRYYQIIKFIVSSYASAVQDYYSIQNFPTQMRAAPNITKTSGSFTNCTEPGSPIVTEYSYSAYARASAAGVIYAGYTVLAEKEL